MPRLPSLQTLLRLARAAECRLRVVERKFGRSRDPGNHVIIGYRSAQAERAWRRVDAFR